MKFNCEKVRVLNLLFTGYEYYRYADDFRIICNSKLDEQSIERERSVILQEM